MHAGLVDLTGGYGESVSISSLDPQVVIVVEPQRGGQLSIGLRKGLLYIFF